MKRGDDSYAFDIIGVVDNNGECKCASCAVVSELTTLSPIYSNDDPSFAYAECIACGYPLKEY